MGFVVYLSVVHAIEYFFLQSCIETGAAANDNYKKFKDPMMLGDTQQQEVRLLDVDVQTEGLEK